MGDGLTADALRLPLQTRRLLLRPPVAADLVAIARLINDPVIAQSTGLIRHPYPVISGWRWLAAVEAPAGPSFHMPYLLTLRSNPRLIAGAVGISVKPHGVPTIGYWVAKAYRRRGFASEAARAMVTLAFSRSDVAAVGASARISNIPSQRVLLGTGMRRVGRGRIKSAQLARYVPTFIYRIDRKAWEKRASLSRNSAFAAEALQYAL